MTAWRITDEQGVTLQCILATAGMTDDRAADLFIALANTIECQARNAPLDDEGDIGETHGVFCGGCGEPYMKCACVL
jgi:hypothetical protein